MKSETEDVSEKEKHGKNKPKRGEETREKSKKKKVDDSARKRREGKEGKRVGGRERPGDLT